VIGWPVWCLPSTSRQVVSGRVLKFDLHLTDLCQSTRMTERLWLRVKRKILQNMCANLARRF